MSALIGSLTGGRSAVIVGPAGVGKTHLAAAVVAAMTAQNEECLRVHGFESARTIPLGALTGSLAMRHHPDGDPTMIADAVAALAGTKRRPYCSQTMRACSTTCPRR